MPLTVRLLAPAFALFLLTSCGYVGEPLPPSLNILVPVQDLAAIQRGDSIVVSFTVPKQTTDGLVLEEIGEVDLRIGTEPVPVEVSGPGPVTFEVPAAKWAGKEAVLGVRIANTRGRFSEWSNPVTLQVIQPLPSPAAFKAESHPEGVRLTWRSEDQRDGLQFRVFRLTETRQTETEKEPATLAAVEGAEYIDRQAQYGTGYQYSVQAVLNDAVSEIAGPVSITPVDQFPPAVPKNLTVIAGLNTIELAWDRNTDGDLKGYIVHRSEGDGTWQPVTSVISTPAYSDSGIQRGKTYKYAVSSVDQKENESARSEPVQITAP